MHTEQSSFMTCLWNSFFSEGQALGTRGAASPQVWHAWSPLPRQVAPLHSQPGLGPLLGTHFPSLCTLTSD